MLAIVGGTGLYELPGLEITQRIHATTPFGAPSGEILRGRIGSNELLFLARHGAGHRLLPHEVNYRANIFALKQAGATMLLGFSAVGSLALELKPGDLAMPEQYFDWTRGVRQRTFFGEGVAAHVSTARPVSTVMVDAVQTAAARCGLKIHRGLTYACVEGPRLGTQAESNFLRHAGCHLVGMTNVPEVFLAREAQIAYATVGLITDYDCWLEDPAQHVSVSSIFELYGAALKKAAEVLDALLSQPLPSPEAESRSALSTAMLTPDAALTPEQKEWLAVLRR
ncbi:MAG: MTAP family purine nucleoside phosphorylase [Burkholderiales bacterium]|jgi:5'-methylthioadenosine phosphorylase|nr:MTAP family purine nucleoside phosphorylase [Burkholderiales bacterium]MCA3161658.1 MTAP family purine nucleoside phosphorylase [Burkholderiales bacterium]MCA3164417.1 MTAP family purine nucleoside phosphorylase [Burkholderiales bacterium]MCA3165498.1 MTAP family purine nucleoside phosphorylase [Burkholderiales bacterium]MCA3170641.1 MTAP family purine nucleoside phosphorylase [Burkholderiales bacterium]